MNRIALPTIEGFKMVNINDIIRCEAHSNYTNIFMADGNQVLVSRQLKVVEKALPEDTFIRVHHSHIVNLLYVERYKRNGGGTLYLTNGESIEVSRSRKNELLEKVKLI